MSKPKPKRHKSYRPRDVQLDAVSWAIAGATCIPPASQAAALAPVMAAVRVLKQGMATRVDWNVVAQCMNLAEALAALQIGSNLMPQIGAGQKALHRIALRMLERGTSTCYATELADIDEAVVMYRVQLSLCTQAEFSRAVVRVKDLHRSGAMDDVARLYLKLDREAA
jgi:DNA-binding FrmR family transcriptional regulator